MDSYDDVKTVYLIDTWEEYSSEGETRVRAYISSEGHLVFKVLKNEKLVLLATYNGRFLVEWKRE